LCYTRGLVQCPKCRKSELDESGSCPVCDTRIQTVTPVEGLARSKRPRIPADNLEEHGPERINDRAQKGEPLPQWRLDLNRRLQKIKQDREALEKTAKLGQLPFPKPELQGRSAPLVQRSRIARKMPRQPARQAGEPPQAESANQLPYPVDASSSEPEPVTRAEASRVGSPGAEESISHYPVDPAPLAAPLSGDSKPEAAAEPSGTGSPGTEESLSHYPVDPAPLAASFSDGSKPEPVAEAEASVASREAGESIPLSNPVEIENLIDSVMAREAIQTQASELPEKIIAPEEVRDEGSPEKLILLSRTLSGLVDLIIVFLCGSAFILVTDTVSGITVFDSLSLLHYSFLLVAIFLVYSLFFLGTANQTIGMMITNLRVVGKSGSRPTFVRLLIRSAVYLLSLLALGAGLIWGFFDADSDCLQDKLSQTHVVRLA
jgi:uncharacterized RDD family membrane protein YckC